MKPAIKFIIAAVIAATGLTLTSCGTPWTVRVTADGITATPDGPIVIKPTK